MDFDNFLYRISPLGPEEQYEELLRFVSSAVDRHSTTELRLLHDHLARVLPDDEHKRTLLELIEGKIAVRDISLDERSRF